MFTSKEAWQDEIKRLWDVINENCYIRMGTSCGTHVHISPEESYTLHALKCVAKAAIYYEPAISSIMPNERKACTWCSSNVSQGPELKHLYTTARKYGYKFLFDEIDAVSDEESLSVLLSPTKAVVWNFRNAIPGQCGTVEFRQPPQVASAETTQQWIGFALTFVKHSLHYDYSQLLNLTAEPTSTDLREALYQAAMDLGPKPIELGPLDDVPLKSEPEYLSAAESEAIRQVKEQKESRFAWKVDTRKRIGVV